VKRRATLTTVSSSKPLDALCEAVGSMRDCDEIRALLLDLCTPAELEAMADRWQVVAPLLGGQPYRDIQESTGVSVTTVGRVARCLASGQGGYRLAAQRLGIPGVEMERGRH